MPDPRKNQTLPVVRVAHGWEDLTRVIAIRAVVFMGEQHCPFDEEFDGNDLAGSTHLVSSIDREPSGTARLRFFANFAHIGRLAVLERFRGQGCAVGIVDYAIRLCAEKGYSRLYAQAQKRLVPFWEQFGFEALPQRREPLVWSDHEYVEMQCSISGSHRFSCAEAFEPLEILRPEGEWDRPGILEVASIRGASNPVGTEVQRYRASFGR